MTRSIAAHRPFMTVTALGIFFDGLIFLVFAYAPTLLLASIAFFALGIANGILNRAYVGGLQTTVPTEMRGRTFATSSAAMNLTAPVSLGVTGVLATSAGPVLLITISGVGLMAVGAIVFLARSARAELRSARRASGLITEVFVTDLPSGGFISLTGTKFLVGGLRAPEEKVELPSPESASGSG